MLLASLVGCRSSVPPATASPDAAPSDGGADLAQMDHAQDATKVDFDAPAADVPDGGAAAACEGSSGAIWAGWKMPDPAARRFDTSGAEVVVDPATGLMWQRKTAPQQLDWEFSKAYCGCLTLGGHDDWRLPTRIELVSLVDYRRQEPSIDLDAFPDTPNTWYWSSSPVAGESVVAWYLSFMDGNTHEAARDVSYGVRCVRGRVPDHLPYQVSTGTVTDPNTGLIWQQALDGELRTWEQASTYCASLPLAGAGWRLPTMSELQSIIDERVKEPAIDPLAFPGTPSEGFWAGTPLAEMPPYRWFVSFDRGIAYNAVPDHLYNVRCVR
jgi:hypothetical protein